MGHIVYRLETIAVVGYLSMKAVILAAGYGTRLQRDVENNTSGTFKHLSGIAKPMLPVGHCPLITHWVQALTATACVDTIYVIVSNSAYLLKYFSCSLL